MSTETKVILVVDDRDDWRQTISMTIETLGHQVQAFSDVGAATQFIEHHFFDLAIIDQRLDETNEEDKYGLELAKFIKKNNSKIPVLIITGYGTLETIEEARKVDENGQRLAARYILKDENVTEELLKAVKETLA